MIAKDSAATIGNAIKQATSIFSQVIVVDTGSADATPSIASALGAEVYYFSWLDDFSAARNYGLEFMRTDWALTLDSDEVFGFDSFMAQKFLLENPLCGGIKVNIINYLNEGGDIIETTHKAVRIFRNLPQIKYEGQIHEQVTPSIIEAGYTIIDSEIIIHHYGYAEKNESKISRNRSLLLDELKKHPLDEWLKYHLAETEFASGNSESAESLFLTLQHSNKLDITELETIKIRLGQIYLHKNNLKKARQALDFVSANKDREGFRLFILAAVEASEGNFRQSIFLYRNPIVSQSAMVGKKLLKKCIKDITGLPNQ